MLKKLLKYDLSNIFKFLIIFYSLAIFFSILTRIFLNIENSLILNIIGQICSGATIAMLANIIINTIMRTWVRFRQNLYGDESYLTHTLPITKKTIYTSKILTALIALTTSMLIITLSIVIAYYSKENLLILKNSLTPLAQIYNTKLTTFLLVIIIVFTIEIANLIQTGITGIIIGHKMNNNKIAMSILFGFISYTIVQVFVLIIMFLIALFNKDFMNLFITKEIINLDILKLVIYFAIVIYTLSMIIIYFINIKLLNKGVDIE